jgi:hypothetical protein
VSETLDQEIARRQRVIAQSRTYSQEDLAADMEKIALQVKVEHLQRERAALQRRALERALRQSKEEVEASVKKANYWHIVANAQAYKPGQAPVK